VIRARSNTLQRLHHRREMNLRRAVSATNDFQERGPSKRQDVCSGLTACIGGGLGELSFKSLRNIMTPLIENLDAAATNRLDLTLKEEAERERREVERKACFRKELIEDTRRRKAYIEALERLSGIKHISPSQSTGSTQSLKNDRLEKLALPREHKQLTTKDCLDGLELVHISNPEALDTLHKKNV
jgi:hypothetical protein